MPKADVVLSAVFVIPSGGNMRPAPLWSGDPLEKLQSVRKALARAVTAAEWDDDLDLVCDLTDAVEMVDDLIAREGRA